MVTPGLSWYFLKETDGGRLFSMNTNTRPPFLGPTQPVYPHLLQLVRVTAATVAGPSGVSQTGGTSVLAPGLYVSYVQQMRDDGSLLPRDREPCLVADVNGGGLIAGFYLCRLASQWTGLPVYEAILTVATNNVAVNNLTVNLLKFNITVLKNITNNYTIDASSVVDASGNVSGRSKFAFSNNAIRNITSISGGTAGQLVVIWNVGAYALTISHLGGNVLVPLGVTYTIWPDNAVILQFDGIYWRFDHPTIGAGADTSAPATYAVQHLKFGSGLTYTNEGEGVGLVTATGGGGSGGGKYWEYYRHIGSASGLSSENNLDSATPSGRRWFPAGVHTSGSQLLFSNNQFDYGWIYGSWFISPRGGRCVRLALTSQGTGTPFTHITMAIYSFTGGDDTHQSDYPAALELETELKAYPGATPTLIEFKKDKNGNQIDFTFDPSTLYYFCVQFDTGSPALVCFELDSAGQAFPIDLFGLEATVSGFSNLTPSQFKIARAWSGPPYFPDPMPSGAWLQATQPLPVLAMNYYNPTDGY